MKPVTRMVWLMALIIVAAALFFVILDDDDVKSCVAVQLMSVSR